MNLLAFRREAGQASGHIRDHETLTGMPMTRELQYWFERGAAEISDRTEVDESSVLVNAINDALYLGGLRIVAAYHGLQMFLQQRESSDISELPRRVAHYVPDIHEDHIDIQLGGFEQWWADRACQIEPSASYGQILHDGARIIGSLAGRENTACMIAGNPTSWLGRIADTATLGRVRISRDIDLRHDYQLLPEVAP